MTYQLASESEIVTWLKHEFEDPDGVGHDLGYTVIDSETNKLTIFNEERTIDLNALARGFQSAFTVQTANHSLLNDAEKLTVIQHILRPEWVMGRVLTRYVGAEADARLAAIQKVLDGTLR